MNIVIRHAEPGDYEAARQVHAGPNAVWGTMQIPFPSAEAWRKRMAEPADGSYNLVACIENEIVGNIVLAINSQSPRRRHAASIGMAVRDDWQGKGVGTALMKAAIDLADKWLNIVRLELEVYTDNEAAVKLYKKFGFRIEGTCIGYAFRDGRYVDAYLMARLNTHSP